MEPAYRHSSVTIDIDTSQDSGRKAIDRRSLPIEDPHQYSSYCAAADANVS